MSPRDAIKGVGPEVALRGQGIRAKFFLGFAIAGLLPLLFVVYLGLPLLIPEVTHQIIYPKGRGFFLTVVFVLTVLEAIGLYICLDIIKGVVSVARHASESLTGVARAEGPAPVGQNAQAGPALPEGLEALFAVGRADEVGALMRDFGKVLATLQQQAAQVQEYGSRFEGINEELRNANVRLREMSLTDELTEVGNRRHFDIRLREELNRSSRFGHTFSLMIVDIDSFKFYNDRYGHQQGDAVLQQLGRLLRSISREGDVPCRVGGEEFAVILPETTKYDATLFAERLRRGVAASVKTPDDGASVTVSVGLAAFPEDAKTHEEIFRTADAALYQSKQGGKNRVTAFARKVEA